MILASAFADSMGLLFTFVLILGGLVNGIVVYIAAQVMGERSANQRDAERRSG